MSDFSGTHNPPSSSVSYRWPWTQKVGFGWELLLLGSAGDGSALVGMFATYMPHASLRGEHPSPSFLSLLLLGLIILDVREPSAG